MSSITHTIIDSPVGPLTLIAHDGILTAVYFARRARKPDLTTIGTRVETGFEAVAAQLLEYFQGTRTTFDVPFALQGDPFQRRVWDLLTTIPYGETCSYGDIARELGNVALARDVGTAVGKNPVSIIVPCHRVIGSDGRLVGYGGGLDRKQFLLDLERRTVGEQLTIGGLL